MIGYVVFALVFWPLALLVILLAEDRTRSREVVLANQAPPGADDLGRVEHLARLRDSGALTEEEFQAEKAKALGGDRSAR